MRKRKLVLVQLLVDSFTKVVVTAVVGRFTKVEVAAVASSAGGC